MGPTRGPNSKRFTDGTDSTAGTPAAGTQTQAKTCSGVRHGCLCHGVRGDHEVLCRARCWCPQGSASSSLTGHDKGVGVILINDCKLPLQTLQQHARAGRLTLQHSTGLQMGRACSAAYALCMGMSPTYKQARRSCGHVICVRVPG